VVVGLTAAPSVALWVWLGARLGIARTFAVACLVEAVGVATSVLWPTRGGALLAAVLLGGTVMGITALGLAGGRRLAAGDPRRALGLLTAAFGVGQIVGPALAGFLYDRTGNFIVPSLLAAAAGRRRRRRHPGASAACPQSYPTERSASMRRLISSGSPFEAGIGYSRAVVDGEWIFVSGTTGFDYEAMTISSDVREQAFDCASGRSSLRAATLPPPRFIIRVLQYAVRPVMLCFRTGSGQEQACARLDALPEPGLPSRAEPLRV